MTRSRVRNAATFTCAAALAILASCGSDSSTGNGPTGSISGTIKFRNTWPASKGAVFVTVFSQYPPTGSPDAFSNEISASMLAPDSTYNYKIGGLETGTYKAVLVGWRGGVNNDTCMGLYWMYPDSVGLNPGFCVAEAPGPLPVTVKKNQTTSGINMLADLDKVP